MTVMSFNPLPLAANAPPGLGVQVIEQYLRALEHHDVPAATGLLSADVVMHVHGHSVIAGDHTGPIPVISTFDTLRQRSGGTCHVVSTLAWLSMGPHVHHVAAEQAPVNGVTLDFNRTVTYQVVDGQITEIRVYEEDQSAFDDFWS